MTKYMSVLMIAYCVGIKRNDKNHATSVVLCDGRIMKRNCKLRYYTISLSFLDYSGFTNRPRELKI